MKTNLLLIFAGIVLLALGLHRACPVSIDKKFMWSNGPIVLAFIALAIWALIIGGWEYFRIGMKDSLAVTSQFLPMLMGIMLVMGFSIIITKYHEITFGNLVSGKYGLLGVFIASVFSPSSTAFAKFVEIMWPTPEARVQLLYLLTATPLVSINLYFVRQIGLGKEIAAMMYQVNFVVAIGLLPFFYVWSKIVAR